MSTLNERDAVRRALFGAVEGVEPRADGLQRIQARLRPPRPLALAWAEAVGTDLRMRVPAAGQGLLEWLRSVISMAWERFGPRSGMSGSRTSRTLSWLRPAAALGVTVFIVAVGAYVAIDAQQAMFPSSSNSAHSNGGALGTGGGSHHGGGPNSQGPSVLGSGASPKATPTCRPRRPAAAGPSASRSAGSGLNTSPTAAPSNPAGSGSPSPTVGSTSSQTPGVTATAQAASPTGGSGVTATVTAPATRTVLTSHSAGTSGLPYCTAKHRATRPAATPNPTPQVFSYGRLDDGG
jgi:hypothetical protein